MIAPLPKKYSPAIEIALRGIADHIKAGGIILQADLEVGYPDLQSGQVTLNIKVPSSATIQKTVKDVNLALLAAGQEGAP